MIKKTFETKVEVNIYLKQQEIRMKNGYLTCSERKELTELLKNPKSLIVKIEPTNPHVRKIVTNIRELHKPCVAVEPKEDISQIIIELKETLKKVGGLGLTANQIGYKKRISYIKMPKMNPKTKKIEIQEFIMINPKILEKSNPIRVKKEECLSFPGLPVDTRRFVFITLQYEDEKRQIHTGLYQDLQAIIIQHEISHQNGRTIFDDKWRK